MALAEAISHDFQVTAISRFMPERSNQEIPIFFFAYWITIKNQGATPAQLLNRYWHIMDADGRVNEVRGEGVVGEQPLIHPGQSFEQTQPPYHSHETNPHLSRLNRLHSFSLRGT